MERPTFYAVIPSAVRYADISAQAKLLYGEITALTEQEGFCWASNGYFARLYNAGARSVSRWLAELEQAGFIKIEPAVNQHGQRKVYLAHALPNVASQKWPAKNGAQNDTRKKTIQEKRETRAQRLETYEPNKVEWYRWARAEFGWSLERCQTVFATFSDHWKAAAGSKGVKADWEATWRNWCRREGQFQKPAAKGEVRVRETTDAERQEAEARKQFLELKAAHPGKSQAEIVEMINQGKTTM